MKNSPLIPGLLIVSAGVILYLTPKGASSASSQPETPPGQPQVPPVTTPNGGIFTAPNPNGPPQPGHPGQGSGSAVVPAGGTRTALNITALQTPLPTVAVAPGTVFSTSDGLIEREPLNGSVDQPVIIAYRKYAKQNPVPAVPAPTAEGIVDPVNSETARRYASDALQSGYPATALALTKLANAKDASARSMGLAVAVPIVQPLDRGAIQAVSDANQVLFGVATLPTANIQALATTLKGFNLVGEANLLTAFIRTNGESGTGAANNAATVPPALLAQALAVTAGMPSDFAAGVTSALTDPNASLPGTKQLLIQLQAKFPNQFPSAVNALNQVIATKTFATVPR